MSLEQYYTNSSPNPHACALPGLAGQVSDYIQAASIRPVREGSNIAALSLMAGLCGKAYNINGTGLNLYFLFLAESGYGKESIASGLNKISHYMERMSPDFASFIGPSEFPDAKSLTKLLQARPTGFVSVMGEAGIYLKRMTHLACSTHMQQLRRCLLELYHKSGRLDYYRDTQPAIQSPGFTLVGESVPSRIWEGVSEQLVRDGMFPRFNIIEYEGQRPKLNGTVITDPPPDMLKALAALTRRAKSLITHGRHGVAVQASPEAQEHLSAFGQDVDDLIAASPVDWRVNFYSRAHLQALRLAALMAVSENNVAPVISIENAKWATAFVTKDKADTLRHLAAHSVDKRLESQLAATRSYIHDFVTLPWKKLKMYEQKEIYHQHQIFSEQYITKRLSVIMPFRNDERGAFQAAKAAVQILVANGEIRKLDTEWLRHNTGYTAIAYEIIGLDLTGPRFQRQGAKSKRPY